MDKLSFNREIFDFNFAIIRPFYDSLCEEYHNMVLYDDMHILPRADELLKTIPSISIDVMSRCIEDVNNILKRDYPLVMNDLISFSILQMPYEHADRFYVSLQNSNKETCNFSFFDMSRRSIPLHISFDNELTDPILEMTGKAADDVYHFVAASISDKLRNWTGKWADHPDKAQKVIQQLLNVVVSNLSTQFLTNPHSMAHFFKFAISPVDIYYIVESVFSGILNSVSFICASSTSPFDNTGLPVTQPPEKFIGVNWLSESSVKLNFDNDLNIIMKAYNTSSSVSPGTIVLEITSRINNPPTIDFVSAM